jgi:hypothetical protein
MALKKFSEVAKDGCCPKCGYAVLATSLIGDVAAALGEHVLATLDEHCGYFRRRARGQADRVNTAMSAAGPSNAP